MGQIFHFFDIGYFDTRQAAHDRGVAWAKALAGIQLLRMAQMVETLRTNPITLAPATGVDDGEELDVILFNRDRSP